MELFSQLRPGPLNSPSINYIDLTTQQVCGQVDGAVSIGVPD